jgi:hypothetical protein
MADTKERTETTERKSSVNPTFWLNVVAVILLFAVFICLALIALYLNKVAQNVEHWLDVIHGDALHRFDKFYDVITDGYNRFSVRTYVAN